MTHKLVVLVAVLAAILVPLPASAGPGPKAQSVQVVNDATQPVPVAPQGTTQIAGTVAVSDGPDNQDVTVTDLPDVTIAGTPEVLLAEGSTVQLADESTAVLLTRTDTLPASSSAGFVSIDVSQMASIRVMVTCGRSSSSWTPAECDNVELRIYDPTCAGCTLAAYRLGDDVTESFDTPGASLSFGGSNLNSAGEPLQVTYRVFGRRH